MSQDVAQGMVRKSRATAARCSHGGGEAVGRRQHERAVAPDGAAAAARGLDAAVADVRQGELADLAVRLRAPGGLVANAGAGPVRRGDEEYSVMTKTGAGG